MGNSSKTIWGRLRDGIVCFFLEGNKLKAIQLQRRNGIFFLGRVRTHYSESNKFCLLIRCLQISLAWLPVIICASNQVHTKFTELLLFYRIDISVICTEILHMVATLVMFGGCFKDQTWFNELFRPSSKLIMPLSRAEIVANPSNDDDWNVNRITRWIIRV